MLQTALDLIDAGYDVHIVADGVSSVNKEEIPWAFDRMRESGVHIVTSEALSFQLMRTLNFTFSDLRIPNTHVLFRINSQVIPRILGSEPSSMELRFPLESINPHFMNFSRLDMQM